MNLPENKKIIIMKIRIVKEIKFNQPKNIIELRELIKKSERSNFDKL